MDLFAPCHIGNLEIPNRFVRSATLDATADGSGRATDRSVEIYEALGQGGTGLVVTGYAFVSSHGQAMPGQYGIHTDDTIPGWRRIVDAVHKGGSRIAIQIVHAGSNTSYLADRGIVALAPSRREGWKFPHRSLTADEIEAIIADFASAAGRAVEVGFDAIQLHGAHGYLMSQFQSPIFNMRNDLWGGSPQNRRRFHLRIIEAIKTATGDGFPLMIKYGVMDDEEGGLSLAEGMETARCMAQAGIDAIEVSAGVGPSLHTARRGEPERAYFRDRAAAVRKAAGIPVIAVGGIRSLAMAQSIVEAGDADMVSMCRPFICEPALVRRWRQGDGRPAECISCNRCLIAVRKAQPLRCLKDAPA